jgi:hypothetical protein
LYDHRTVFTTTIPEIATAAGAVITPQRGILATARI